MIKNINHKNKRLIIRFVGGPGGKIIHNTQFDFSKILFENDILISLGYIGTYSMYKYPGTGLQDSCEHAKHFLMKIVPKFVDYEIVIVGESLGGIVALCSSELLEREYQKNLSELLLIGVPLGSPKDYFIKRKIKYGENVNNIDISNSYGFPHYNIDAKIENIDSSMLFKEYFENIGWNVKTYDRINNSHFTRIHYIYGQYDDIVGDDIDDIGFLKKIVKQKIINGAKHDLSISFGNYDSFDSYIKNVEAN